MNDPDICEHKSAIPQIEDEELKGLSSQEVRKRYPRFSGKCPDCGCQLVAYASWMHYLAGDW